MKTPFKYPLLLLLCFPIACGKTAFLNTKPDESLIIPSTLSDCQALLNNSLVMNGQGNSGYPSLGQTGCDDYYTITRWYELYSPEEQNAIIWAPGIYADEQVNDWDLSYRSVLSANEVLQALQGIDSAANQPGWDLAKGSALFYRSFSFWSLAQVFAPAFDSLTANRDAGICLRLQADMTEKLTRATVLQTYTQIISDLREAISLLPAVNGPSTTQPCRAAAYGLMARVYLGAGDYKDAFLYADSSLQLQNSLMDYNMISPPAGFTSPFTHNNPEVIFDANYFISALSVNLRSYTDSGLYKSYDSLDLRKSLFFLPGINIFIGRYDENNYGFCGIATDEMYLTRAECAARAGNKEGALQDLNTLLIHRWTNGSFTPVTAADSWEALQRVLQERRKELLYRGLRWPDLRRLNKDPRTALTLNRTIQGIAYTLPPGDPKYTYAIPPYVITDNPGMIQNQR